MIAGALLLASALGASALQVAVEPGGLTVRVPVRGAPGVPEVRPGGDEVVVEVPDAKLDRASAAIVDGAGRRLPVEEVSASTSRSRHRALLSLRLRQGAALPPERVSAQISQGVLTVRVAADPAAVAAPAAAGGERALAESKHSSAAGAAGAASAAAATAPSGARAAQPAAPPAGESVRGALLPARAPAELALRALPFLLGLGVVGWLLLRQRAGKLGPGRGEVRPSAISIVATRALGRSQRLMVVDVDKRRFLLSASDSGGVSLLSPIDGAAQAVERVAQAAQQAAPAGQAPQAGRGKDGLDKVFDDMLQDLSHDKAAPTAGKAAAPARPARPVLQLVDDEPEAAAPAAAPAPASASASAAAATTAPRRPVTAEIPGPLSGPGSADVAGLIALRQGRASGALGRKGVAR